MGRVSPRVTYAGAGVALVVALAAVGISGHGLPAVGMQLRSGQAWLANAANHTVSFIDGYSGEVVSYVSVPGEAGSGQVVNTANGAVVVGTGGHMISVSNDNFTTTSSVQLLGGGPLTAAAGGPNALYAVNASAGEVQQLNPDSPQLPPVGLPISVGSPIVTPVVAPDGSLYVGVPKAGAVGHITDGRLAMIKGVAKPGGRLAVLLAGQQPAAADLTDGVLRSLGAASVDGQPVTLSPRVRPVADVSGSDSLDGLLGAVGSGTVDSGDVTTGAVSGNTGIPGWFTPTSAAMLGADMVLIDDTSRDVLFVDTAKGTTRQFTMPGTQPPDQVSVHDGLVFVNASDGPAALVINGDGQLKPITKYTAPPPPQKTKPATLPPPAGTPAKQPATSQPGKTGQPSQPGRPTGPPKPPGAPANPVALAGNALAQVSWGAAADNNSPVTRYLLSWPGGSQQVAGNNLGATVTGLTNGTSYTFTIQAQNAVGTGPQAQTAPVTPSSSVPATPATVQASAPADDGSVQLTWTEPSDGDQAVSYNVTNAATGATTTGITGTSATIAGVVSSATAFTSPPASFTFTVTAVDAGGRVSQPSAPSAAVTPYLPPGTPAVDTNTIEYTTNGTSVTLSVSCDATCAQGGTVQSYTVAPGNGVAAVTATAAAGGAATSVTVSGLTPNTNYTAEVTATDSAGFATAAASALAVPLATLGPPTITGVSVTQPTIGAGAGAEIAVAVTVNPGGESSSCTYSITVSGGGSDPGVSCATTAAVDITVPSYNTSYSVTVTAANAAGGAPAYSPATGTSSLKAMTLNALTAFNCSSGPYCGGDAHLQSGPVFNASTEGALVPENGVVYASCENPNGGAEYGADAAYPSSVAYHVWVQVTSSYGNGWASELYFPSPPSVASGLPAC
jgi:Fibronectin type III domain